MGYELSVSDSAERDLDSIVYYISALLDEDAAATRFLDKVDEAYKQLISNPYIYSVTDNLRLQSEGYRKIVIGKYILMFTVDEERKCVFVHRFFYGAMDYEKKI